MATLEEIWAEQEGRPIAAPAPHVLARGASGQWETHVSTDGVMIHAKWSLPNADGNFLFALHYENNSWGSSAVRRQVREWNDAGKLPILRHGRGEILWPRRAGEESREFPRACYQCGRAGEEIESWAKFDLCTDCAIGRAFTPAAG